MGSHKKTISKKAIKGFLISLLIIFTVSFTFAKVKYPLRKLYKQCKPISTAKLKRQLKKMIVIDVRSKIEYDVAHIDSAVNILVGKMTKEDLQKVIQKKGRKPFVFYCNGITCKKSYKATLKAQKWGYEDSYVYDAGMPDWVKKAPSKTIMFGKKQSKRSIKRLFIKKRNFLKKTVSPKNFIKKYKSGKYFVIDARDRNERKEDPIKLKGIRQIPFDSIIKLIKKNKVIPKNNLLILDNVGKQVRWLEFYFRKYKIRNYWFLKGGVRNWKKKRFNANGECLKNKCL